MTHMRATLAHPRLMPQPRPACCARAGRGEKGTELDAEPAMTHRAMTNKLSPTIGLALISGATLGAAVLGALVSPGRSASTRRWFKRLDKPPFQPPDKLFGPVWSVLYPAIAWSGYRTFRAPPSPARTRALAFWVTQLGLNAAWSPLFFGLHRPKASLADSTLLLAAASNYTRLAREVDKPAAIAMLPYLGWLTFATVLNADIVRRNA